MPSSNGGHSARRPNWTGYLFIAGLLALAAVALLVWTQTRSTEPKPGADAKPLVVGYQTSPAMALIMVAEAKGYFDKVQLKEFTAGKLALQAFLGGQLDVAVAGDVPIGLALLQGQKPVAFAEVVTGSEEEVRMIVRQSPCDVNGAKSYFMTGKKKKIATSFGGGPQYFSVKFLESVGVPLSRVELVSMGAPDMAGAVESESVDGAAIFDPAAAKIERSLGSSGCTFADPKAYRQHYIAVASPALTSKTPDPRLVAFVRALRKAETFVVEHPDEAKEIVRTKTKIDNETLDHLWPKFKFGVVLDKELPRLWMQQSDFYRSQPTGNFTAAEPAYSGAMSESVLQQAK